MVKGCEGALDEFAGIPDPLLSVFIGVIKRGREELRARVMTGAPGTVGFDGWTLDPGGGGPECWANDETLG
jgi:hypothetical protein